MPLFEPSRGTLYFPCASRRDGERGFRLQAGAATWTDRRHTFQV